MTTSYLSNFERLDPPNKMSQQETVSWLQNQHNQYKSNSNFNLEKYFKRFSVKPSKISQRYIAHPDIHTKDLDSNQIFSPEKQSDIKYKNNFYTKYVEDIFRTYYPDKKSLPDHLIHVSCTGYVSPSGPQVII